MKAYVVKYLMYSVGDDPDLVHYLMFSREEDADHFYASFEEKQDGMDSLLFRYENLGYVELSDLPVNDNTEFVIGSL